MFLRVVVGGAYVPVASYHQWPREGVHPTSMVPIPLLALLGDWDVGKGAWTSGYNGKGGAGYYGVSACAASCLGEDPACTRRHLYRYHPYPDYTGKNATLPLPPLHRQWWAWSGLGPRLG